MNRSIEFRGIRLDGGGWLISNCIDQCKDGKVYMKHYVDPNGNTTLFMWLEVKPDTIGQYTGLLDRKGVKVFDGDVIKLTSKDGFHSELLTEFKELKGMDTINGICNHFEGIVRIDFQRGLMFENPENGYREPMFSRHIDINSYIQVFEVVSNIHDPK